MEFSQAVKTNVYRLVMVIGLILIAVGGSFSAQMKTLTIDDPEQLVLIKEFGGMVLFMEDKVKVEMTLPPSARADAYKTLDIQAGDIIKMANGKKLTSVKPLKEIYENAAIGDEIKLGILRDGKMVMAKFKKADPDDLPGQMMIQMGPEGGDDTGISMSLIDAGLLLVDKNNQIIVEQVIDKFLAEFSGHSPETGDMILKLQGKEIKSPDEFVKMYDQIKIGEDVNLILSHKGKEVKTAFVKPDAKAQRKVIKNEG